MGVLHIKEHVYKHHIEKYDDDCYSSVPYCLSVKKRALLTITVPERPTKRDGGSTFL
jgi:hypothetical protein